MTPERVGPELSRTPDSRGDAVFEGLLGGYYSGQSWGYSAAFTGLVRYAAMQVGARLAGTSELTLESTYSAAALGGLVLQLGDMRLDLMALVGVRYYSDVGSSLDFFGSNPGADAMLGFGGATWSLSYVVGRPATNLYMLVGVRAQIDRDFRQVTRHYIATSTNFIFGGTDELERSVKIGTTTYMLGVTATALTPL